ncbi:serine hydrolase [Glaciecola sp. 33A]|uniref:serine hydrolase domain-containing protein n=1 Tax=Glaciecola sp. 33A TaxID=2057807 RepID=UPI0012FF33DA|nr:serine hydrolase domain-containing protein [Glaciecola sp. 33A]
MKTVLQSTKNIILLCSLIIGFQVSAEKITEVENLVKDKVLTESLEMGDTHVYNLKLDAGQYVFGDAVQITVDLKVSIYKPDGEQLVSFDGPARGSETFQFNSTDAGIYQIKITPFQEEEGDYSIKIIRIEAIAKTPAGKVDQLMSAYTDKTPGVVIGVVRDGKLDFVRSYGLANIEYDIPNTRTTPFHMASVSKQFTAFAIVMLAQDGKLSLDEEIHKYLPELPKFEHKVTVRHLLNHTSGIRDHWTLWQMSGGRMDDVIRQEDLLRLLHRQQELNFKPGKQYMYSNSGYLLLSEIVSSVSGEKFGDWMQKNVFKPLNMNSTQIYDDHERIVKNRAYSYHYSNAGIAKSVLSYANSGATSLFSTVEDLALWLNNFKTGKIGGIKTIEELQVQGMLNNGETIRYALGIGVDEENGLRKLSHGGADAGYRSYLSYYPEIDSGIILLSNIATFSGGLISQDIATAFFSEKMTFESQEGQATMQENSTQSNEKAEKWIPNLNELKLYEGRYYSKELDTFYTVYLDDEKLLLKHTRHGDISLTEKDKDYFQSSVGFMHRLYFSRSEKGDINQFRVSNGRVRNLVFNKMD